MFLRCTVNDSGKSVRHNDYLSSLPRGRMSRPSQKSEQASSRTSAMPWENICFMPVSHTANIRTVHLLYSAQLTVARDRNWDEDTETEWDCQRQKWRQYSEMKTQRHSETVRDRNDDNTVRWRNRDIARQTETEMMTIQWDEDTKTQWNHQRQKWW